MSDQAEGYAYQEFKDNPELDSHREWSIPLPPIEGPHAEVSRELGLTVNLGNYESARTGVGLRWPCKADPVVAKEVFAAIHEILKEEIQKEVQEMRSKGR